MKLIHDNRNYLRISFLTTLISPSINNHTHNSRNVPDPFRDIWARAAKDDREGMKALSPFFIHSPSSIPPPPRARARASPLSYDFPEGHTWWLSRPRFALRRDRISLLSASSATHPPSAPAHLLLLLSFRILGFEAILRGETA